MKAKILQKPPASPLRAEILEQPAAVARLLDAEGARAPRILRALGRKARFVMIAARGTSDNAARYAQYAFALRAGLPVALASPSIVTLYKTTVRARGSLFIGISQSGMSPDIVESLASAKRAGARTLAIVNNTNSPLARAADEVLPLHAGVERSIAATKTYTAELAAVALAAESLRIADSPRAGRGLAPELYRTPETIQKALRCEAAAETGAGILRKGGRAVVLARGVHLCTSHEISLKLKELARVLAEPYSSADFEHGPIALAGLGLPVIVLCPPGTPAAAELRALSDRLAAKGCPVFEIGTRGGVKLPRAPEWLAPLSTIVAGQWLALHAALLRGLDPDRPAGITKITETL
ncbi:MAG: SIS domain-containing protein [Planctomycetes bacterium]|nr:SIS domain-containing protein [Planctomycetota bacterium]